MVGFDVGDSDWPLRASFVLFFRNILEQARVHRTEAGEGATRAGEPLRVALTGTTISPGIFESIALLGREETLRRVDAALARPAIPTGAAN